MNNFRITVWFATNRNRKSNSPPEFGSRMMSGSELFRLGCVDVEVKASAVNRPWRANDWHMTIGTPTVFPNISAGLRAFAAQYHSTQDFLCFIPGFLYSFWDSIKRAALLAALYSGNPEEPLTAMVFSWPSQDSVLAYPKDREMASRSGPAIVSAMDHLANCGEHRFHLVAHSLGAHVSDGQEVHLSDEVELTAV
ncbi:MAG: alpha/beta hydrolase, partial [bacterium]|nr:alpha/beta hydrolase [bacterium]